MPSAVEVARDTPARRTHLANAANRALTAARPAGAHQPSAAKTVTEPIRSCRQLRGWPVRKRLAEVRHLDELCSGERRDRRATRATRARPRPESGSSFDRTGEQELRLVGGAPRAREPPPCAHDPLAYVLRRLGRWASQLLATRARHCERQVEAIEQRARQLLAVAMHPLRCAGALRAGSPRAPHGQRFIVATSWKRAGKAARPATRATVTTPSSSGCRSASSAARGNSGNSSRKSTPPCARLASPGRGPAPPPTIAAVEAEWCGARNGGTRTRPPPGGRTPATEWMRVTSSAASSSRSGRIPGNRRASIVFPVPGGPASSRLWPPAAATSSARRARS